MQDGLLVGPAMGFVGELVRARVTVKLCPSQPFVDSFSDPVSGVNRVRGYTHGRCAMLLPRS